MYYEFATKNGFDYYALIKANHRNQALKEYEEQIAEICIDKVYGINELTEDEVVKIYTENVEDEIYTIEKLRNEPTPSLILIDGALS